MTDQPAEEAHRTGRSVRLDTLVRLRWLAVIGQTTAVLVVYFGLDYELPIWACLAVIALAAWPNGAPRIRFPLTQRLRTHPGTGRCGCLPSTLPSSRCCCSSPAACRTRSRCFFSGRF